MKSRRQQFAPGFAVKIRSAVVLAAAATLGGCQSSYTLGVKNATDQPITVAVVETGSASAVLATKWLGPGDSATLGPGLAASDSRVELVAESRANAFAPATIQVAKGWTSYDIQRSGAGRLLFVQRDQK